MARGYIEKFLWVNLSNGNFKEEIPDERLNHDFIGGYGVGARVLYNQQKAGANPLGPENILGIVTGPLTGTPVPFGCRYAVVSKSPLTGGWGDSNCGGDFGPNLKFAGYDAIFIVGISEEPVYLVINNGKAELKPAAKLWGKSTFETEELLKAEYGDLSSVLSIGLSGEKLNLIASLITHRGSAAGRSGMGAVMGSKHLKAIVVKGEQKVQINDIEVTNQIRKYYLSNMRRPIAAALHTFGTGIHAAGSVHSGDTPIKNWGGVGVKELPDVSGLEKEILNAKIVKRGGCWHCPVACRGELKAGDNEHKYPAGTKRPEYETMAAFGGMCLNTNSDAIAMANHICNYYGIDTISTGTVISFAMECYEQGIITIRDTDGIDLKWGNHQAMVLMAEKIARREGFGAILADGVRLAAKRIGKGSEEFAVHIGGQELGLHDPKFDFPAFSGTPTAAKYAMDAAPGRHTAGFGPTQFQGYLVNSSGLCLHMNTFFDNPNQFVVDFMKAVTGWDRSLQELLKTGERIGNMRHLFTVREGDNPLNREVHGRIIGNPPFIDGPVAGVTLDLEAQSYWNLGALDWDRVTTKPSKKKLLELGLDDIAKELWPEKMSQH